MSIPATRTLPFVLRSLTQSQHGVTFLIGTYASPLPDPEGRTYANVTIEGETLAVPKLAGVVHGTEGQPAYILTGQGRMLVLGTVSN